jgi:hypothetical protein
MSKTLWHTISIKVPSEMVELTKTGKVSVKRTLTKLNNVSKSQKMPSIKLIPSNINKPEIVNDGKEWDIEELKAKMKKANELAKKNKGKVLTKNSGSKMKEFKTNLKSFVEDVKKKVEKKKVYQIKVLTKKYISPDAFTRSKIFKEIETEDGYIFYFDTKKDYDMAINTFDEKFDDKDFTLLIKNEKNEWIEENENRKRPIISNLEAKEALKKIEESNKGLSFSQGIVKMKQNIEKQNIINFINKFKPLLINESIDYLNDEKIKMALNQLYKLRNRTDDRGQSNLTDKDIENWGAKYGLTYKTGRTGVKTSREFIDKQKKGYINDIKKKFFDISKGNNFSNEEEEEPKQLIEKEPQVNMNELINKMTQLILKTPNDKIMKALVKLKYKGRMNTNKILLAQQLQQNFNTIDKMNLLINELEGPKFEKQLEGGLSNLILHAIILKKPEFQTKEQAYDYSQKHFNEYLKNKKFIRETTTSFRVRVHPKQQFEKTTFVSKKISPNITLVFGKPNEKYKGGVIEQEELKKFVDAGYEKKKDVKNIDGYVLDNELSTRRDKVYVNPNTGKVVHTISGTDSLKDWSNNLLIPFGLHSKTNRYKNAEETQKKANAKYGKQNVSVVSHSQSGNIADNLAKRDLVGDENITLNPAIIGKPNKKVKVVKSYFDPVSYFTKTKKGDVVLKPSSINPLKEHSTKILN